MRSLMPRNSRPQRADAAHQQLDVEARLRRAVQRPDHLVVGQGVHLDDQTGRTARLGVLGLPVDQLFQLLPQPRRRHHQAAVLGLVRVAGQEIEHVRGVADDVGIRRDQADVRVHPRRHRVVVAGAGVHVLLDAVRALADHQAQLRVGLEVGEPVDHVDAVRFQLTGPDDVVALVEPRLQLHQDRHLLAGLGRLDEQRNQRGLRSDPVERHLDGDDVRIAHRGAEERLHRAERLERVVQQHVLIADQVENRFRVLVDAPQHRRRERRVLQVRPRDAGHAHPVAESQAVARPEHHLVGRLEVLHQDVERALGHVAFDLQEGQRTVPQLLQASVHGLQQIVAARRRSSNPRSESRTMRNRCAALTTVSGNSAWMFALITSSMKTNVTRARRRQRRRQLHEPGRLRGTFTRANLVRPPCCTATARLVLRLETNGNGCPGSNASGVSTGKTSRAKSTCAGASAIFCVQSCGSRKTMRSSVKLAAQARPHRGLLVQHRVRDRGAWREAVPPCRDRRADDPRCPRGSSASSSPDGS